jgi:hypothetical protein
MLSACAGVTGKMPPQKMDIKPNFFIIGAAKAATTSLSSMLSVHPEAGIVRGKEPHFLIF